MILKALGAAYGAAAARRRRWYARHPERRRRLTRPVVSVGNLRVGGAGKTPIVEYVARLLVEAGERPAVLTRGYGRARVDRGVTVVSDGAKVVATLDRSGDEPLMLARNLRGVVVLVGANRFLSGTTAESEFGATIHLLDDGFQHLGLERDVDLLLVDEEDLEDAPLPAGRLREPLAGAAMADAALVAAGYTTAAERIGRALGIETVFRTTRALGPPRRVVDREPVVVPPASRVFVVAGIARPERFISDVAAAGWDVVGTMTFRDHHRFTVRDVKRIAAEAKAAAAAIVLTTEKDAVRLGAVALGDLPIAWVPLIVHVEPPDGFRTWLLERVRQPRAAS